MLPNPNKKQRKPRSAERGSAVANRIPGSYIWHNAAPRSENLPGDEVGLDLANAFVEDDTFILVGMRHT